MHIPPGDAVPSLVKFTSTTGNKWKIALGKGRKRWGEGKKL